MPDGNGGTASSCTQFCAYHSTTAANGTIPEFYYGVIPNVTSDGCELGCGPVGGGINNTTSVASHELIEAVTDAEVGLANSNAPPLAWYDPQGQDGEIGDICNGSQGTVTSHGRSWTVQSISGGQSGGGGGGTCPPGTTNIGGVCVPTGCGSTGGGATWLGALAAGAFLLGRRRSPGEEGLQLCAAGAPSSTGKAGGAGLPIRREAPTFAS